MAHTSLARAPEPSPWPSPARSRLAVRQTMGRLSESRRLLERTRALHRETLDLVEASRRIRRAVLIATLDPKVAPANAPRAWRDDGSARRCAHRGCTAAPVFGVEIVASIDTQELILRVLSMRVCEGHRAIVAAAVEDPCLVALWRANVELRLARTVELRSVRAIFTAQR